MSMHSPMKRSSAFILPRFIGPVFFFQAEDGIRGGHVTGVQTCALPILSARRRRAPRGDDHGEEFIVCLLPRKRSEERRVGKECRSRWSTCHEKRKWKLTTAKQLLQEENLITTVMTAVTVRVSTQNVT